MGQRTPVGIKVLCGNVRKYSISISFEIGIDSLSLEVPRVW